MGVGALLQCEKHKVTKMKLKGDIFNKLFLIYKILDSAGSVKANGREPKSCLGRVFHFKIGSFVVM